MRPSSLGLAFSLLLPVAAMAQTPPPAAPAVPAAPAAPTAADAAVYSVDPAQSKLTYFLVHKLHKFNGTSKQLEGKARILPSGVAQVGLRAAVESFDSGNNNRDAHMKEVTEAGKHKYVALNKVSCDGVSIAATGGTVDKTCKGEVSFHGIQKMVDVPVKLTWSSPSSIHATAKLSLSLDEFKVERPSLLFVKVDDTMEIEADIVFKK